MLRYLDAAATWEDVVSLPTEPWVIVQHDKPLDNCRCVFDALFLVPHLLSVQRNLRNISVCS